LKQENNSALEANRYHLSAKDFNAALKYLHACVELKEKDEESGKNQYSCHQEGLLIAAIISYGRPFKRSWSKDFATPSITVDLPQVFNAVEDHVSFHEHIIELRDKAVAHSDPKFHKTELVKSPPDTSLVHRKSSVVHCSEIVDLEMFITIAKAMALHCSCRSYEIDANTGHEGDP
jgi:hypothetical protein